MLMRRNLPLSAAISLALLGVGGCAAPQSTAKASAPACPTQAEIHGSARSGEDLTTTLHGAQCVASFPVQAPRWIPSGSHLVLVDVAFAPLAGSAKPKVTEVDLFYSPDNNQHSFYVFERVGSVAAAAGATTVEIAGRSAQVLVSPPTLAQSYPLAEVTLPGGDETYLIQGGVQLQTAERIAASLVQP